MATNAVYKIYNGTNGWVDYHLKTNAAQVIMTNARKFITSETTVNGQAFSLGQNDNTASVTIDGTHITGSAIAVSGSSLQYVGANDSIAVALGKLDKAAKDAYNHVPADVLTSSNYAQTLGNVYQAKGDYQPLDNSLTAIATLGAGNSANNYGLLARFLGGWQFKSISEFVPSTRTVNTHQLSQDIVLGSEDILFDFGEPANGLKNNMTIGQCLSTLAYKLAGKVSGFGIDVTVTNNNDPKCVNSSFNSSNEPINISVPVTKYTYSDGSYHWSTDYYIIPLGRDEYGKIFLSELDEFSNIFISALNLPDRWLASITYPSSGTTGTATYTFYKLETQKVDLSNYATKGTTLSHYGITDAKIENGVITLGNSTITPLTQHQDLSGRAPNNHASSATTYGLGTSSLYGHVKLVSGDLNGKSAADGMAASQSHTHSQYLTSHQSLAGYATETWVDNNFVRCTASSSAPSNPSAGDIWIDTHN